MRRDKRPQPTDRRSFLKTSAAGLLLGGLASCSDGEQPVSGLNQSQTQQPTDDLLIVGGGLCGLALLDSWTQMGGKASLVEAADRVGGRILTLRKGLSPELRFEAGAERIPSAHLRLRQLIARLKLRTQPYVPPSGSSAATLHWNGAHRFRMAADLPKSLMQGLSAVEKKAFPHLIASELAATAGTAGRQQAEGLNGWEWLKGIGMTKAAEPFVLAFCPYPLRALPAPQLSSILLREHGFGADVATLQGGTDQITQALAGLHQNRIRRGAPVAQVAQTASGVTLTLGDGTTLNASRVAFCIPPKALMDIAFSAGPPPELLRRTADLVTENEIKIGLELPGAALQSPTEALGLWSFRPTFPRVTWTLPERTANGGRVMQAMALLEDLDEAAPAVAQGPESLRRLIGLQAPEIAQAAGMILAHDFGCDPLAGGAWNWSKALGPPSEEDSVITAGRLVFAGSDFTHLSGWMEGALLSAETAASALLS